MMPRPAKPEQGKIARDKENARLKALQEQASIKKDIWQPIQYNIPVEETVIHADAVDSDAFSAAYTNKFSKEPWYKDPKKNKDGSSTYTFPSEKAAMDFCEELAKAHHAFIMVNADTRKVLCYSDGSGTLNKNAKGKTLDELQAEFHWHKNRPGMK